MSDQNISKVARKFIDRYNLTWRDTVEEQTRFVNGEEKKTKLFSSRFLMKRVGAGIYDDVSRMKDEALGAIVAQGIASMDTGPGRTSLYHTLGGNISMRQSGADILHELATATIISEIADQLRCQMELEGITAVGVV